MPRKIKTEDSTRVFVYTLAYDHGFAPNPFRGCCTLACCKPKIRGTAQVGDIIVGHSRSREGSKLTYYMQVSEVMDFSDYWNDSRFKRKRPNMGSKNEIDRVGDNMYEPIGNGKYKRHNCQHDNDWQQHRDLSYDRVLIGQTFSYYGGQGPAFPKHLQHMQTKTQGHKCRFGEEDVHKMISWLETFPEGIHGEPGHDWPDNDRTWKKNRKSCG